MGKALSGKLSCTGTGLVFLYNNNDHEKTENDQDSMLFKTSYCSYARPAQPGPIRWLGLKQA